MRVRSVTATGAAAVCWFDARDDAARTAGVTDGLWYVVVPVVIAAMIFWVASGRIRATSDGVAIYGDYDTLDLAYYASIASELGHTDHIPPRSPFYAGHHIVYSYFPLLFLAEVTQFDANIADLVLVDGVWHLQACTTRSL